MKLCIVGAGAIGGFIGARVAANTDAPVSALARGATLAALRRHGWRLRLGDRLLQAPAHASDDPTELGVQDVVVIAVKAPSLETVAGAIGPLIGPLIGGGIADLTGSYRLPFFCGGVMCFCAFLAALVLVRASTLRGPLDFSVFPALLLGTTLFRLVINVASTRLILGAEAATPAEARRCR